MGGNVGNGLLHPIHALHSQDIIQKFRVEVLRSCGGSGDDGLGEFIQPQFYLGDGFCQFGQEFRGDGFINEQHFLRIADTGAAGLSIFDDLQGHFLVGGALHIHMADAGSGGDAGNGGIFHAGIDQTRAAPGDQQVDKAVGSHQRIGAAAGGVLHQIYRVFRDSHGFQARFQRGYDGIGAAEGLLTAPEDTDIAAFQGQGCRIGGDVGTAFVDNGDDTHGHGGFLNFQAVGTDVLLQNRAHRVRKLYHIPDALGHTGDSSRGQGQPVQHHIGHGAPGGLQVQCVGSQNGFFSGNQRGGHGLQSCVLPVSCQPGNFQFCRFCGG